jgi:hypothetical protein
VFGDLRNTNNLEVQRSEGHDTPQVGRGWCCPNLIQRTPVPVNIDDQWSKRANKNSPHVGVRHERSKQKMARNVTNTSPTNKKGLFLEFLINYPREFMAMIMIIMIRDGYG